MKSSTDVMFLCDSVIGYVSATMVKSLCLDGSIVREVLLLMMLMAMGLLIRAMFLSVLVFMLLLLVINKNIALGLMELLGLMTILLSILMLLTLLVCEIQLMAKDKIIVLGFVLL